MILRSDQKDMTYDNSHDYMTPSIPVNALYNHFSGENQVQMNESIADLQIDDPVLNYRIMKIR